MKYAIVFLLALLTFITAMNNIYQQKQLTTMNDHLVQLIELQSK